MEVILLERVGKLGHMGDTRARQGRLRPQFPAAARQGPARDRGEQEEVREPARRPRGAQPRTQERRRGQVGQARRQELHHHSPGRRNRAALRVGVGSRHRGGDFRRRLPHPSQPHIPVASHQDAGPAQDAGSSASGGRGECDDQCRALARTGGTSGQGRGSHTCARKPRWTISASRSARPWPKPARERAWRANKGESREERAVALRAFRASALRRSEIRSRGGIRPRAAARKG